MNNAANNMVDIIRDIIRQEMNKKDQTILCKIIKQTTAFHYDVYVVPDEDNVIHNIINSVGLSLNEGDYVYVYKINNQLSNAFIISKVNPPTKSGGVSTEKDVIVSGGVDKNYVDIGDSNTLNSANNYTNEKVKQIEADVEGQTLIL